MRITKFVSAVLFILLALTFTFAQEAAEEKPAYGWKKEGVANLNFTQNQFDNWSQGGEDSWSWQLDINAKFVNDQEKYNWTNTGKVSYGKTKVASAGAKKAADEIKLESVYTYKMSIYINPYVAVTGQTQFTDGFDYSTDPATKVSGLMDPAYFTQSAGLGFDVSKNIKTRLGAALKETITKTDMAANLFAKGEKTRVEYGAESVTDANFKLAENLLYTSKLVLFSNIKGVDEIDVDWDNVFSAKVSKYISVSLNIKLLYDKDISSRRQLKQTLAAGLSYALF